MLVEIRGAKINPHDNHSNFLRATRKKKPGSVHINIRSFYSDVNKYIENSPRENQRALASHNML